jgi:hypothetical protein
LVIDVATLPTIRENLYQPHEANWSITGAGKSRLLLYHPAWGNILDRAVGPPMASCIYSRQEDAYFFFIAWESGDCLKILFRRDKCEAFLADRQADIFDIHLFSKPLWPQLYRAKRRPGHVVAPDKVVRDFHYYPRSGTRGATVGR